tara:strand:- start:1769 stop:2389 length:621 start_codon:yes stop_codon:yes gene_type:complete
VRALIRVLIAFVILTALPGVAAEGYTISGTVTYSNDVPADTMGVVIECAEFEYDCHEFRGTSSQTDRMGVYEISIEIDETYDGAELFLTIGEESFSHIIDIEESRSPPSGTVTQDIQLEQDSPPSSLFTGVACGGIIILLAIFATLDRRPIRDQGDGLLRAANIDVVTCPICEGRLQRHLLIRHLIVDHDIEPSEASRMSETDEEE